MGSKPSSLFSSLEPFLNDKNLVGGILGDEGVENLAISWIQSLKYSQSSARPLRNIFKHAPINKKDQVV